MEGREEEFGWRGEDWAWNENAEGRERETEVKRLGMEERRREGQGLELETWGYCAGCVG